MIQTTPSMTMTITGERRHGRLLLLINQKPVWLTAAQFAALSKLVHSRAETATGYVSVSDVFTPVAVFRLRRSIDHAVGTGTGESLIESGVYREYRLSIPASSISVDTSFRELPAGIIQESEQRRLCDVISELEPSRQ